MKTLLTYIVEKQNHSWTKDDFSTERGRNKIAKDFMPGIMNIINANFINYDKEELFSAGLEILAKVINRVDISKYTEAQITAFIMDTIKRGLQDYTKHNSHTVKISGNKDIYKKQYNQSIQSLLLGDEGGYEPDFNWHNILIDHSADFKFFKNDKFAKQIEDILKQKFNDEWIEIFMKAWHLYGHDNDKKQKDVANEYGLKPNTFNSRITKMVEYLRSKLTLDDIEESLSNNEDIICESQLSDKVFCEQFSKMFKDTKLTKDTFNTILNNLDKDFVIKLNKYFSVEDTKNYIAYEPSEDLFLKYEDNKEQILSQIAEYIVKYKL